MSQEEAVPLEVPDWAANLVLATGIGYVAAAYAISRWLTRPSPGGPGSSPTDHGLDWEPLHCVAADGLFLRGWVTGPSRPRGTVALFHGIQNNRSQTLTRSAFLVAEGYRCVAFDHRAHGESAGKRSSFGFHESRDVAAVLDLIARRWPNEPRFALGISMGGAAICYAAAQARHCDGVILESVYHDIGRAFESRLRGGYPPSFRRLRHGVVWLTERRLGVKMHQLAPVDYLAELAPAPVLLLTGTEDPHATPEEARQMWERCAGRRELCLVPGAGHGDLFEQGGDAYRVSVRSFLSRAHGERSAAA